MRDTRDKFSFLRIVLSFTFAALLCQVPLLAHAAGGIAGDEGIFRPDVDEHAEVVTETVSADEVEEEIHEEAVEEAPEEVVEEHQE